VYNGEIYNFREIRAELERCGVSFRTQSDTEVVAEALEQWGVQALATFDGMFALVAIDREEEVVIAARDRVGIKPLYFAVHRDLVIFGSTPTILVRYPGFVRRVSPAALSTIMSYRHIPAGSGMFEGVHSVGLGTVVRVRAGAMTEERYWQPRVSRNSVRDVSSAAVKQQVYAATRSVQSEQVPQALLLSGGLDSSILAFASQAVPTKPTAYVASLPDAKTLEEVPAATAIAQEAGLPLVEVPITSSIDLESMREISLAKGAPVAYHNELAMLQLCRAVGASFKIVICGEGADEIFCGYPRIFRFPWDYKRHAMLSRLPDWIRSRAERRLGHDDRFGSARDPLTCFLQAYEYFPRAEHLQLFRPQYQALQDENDAAACVQRILRQSDVRSIEDLVQAFFISVHLPGILQMVDATSMCSSVEARVPFLKNWFLDYAWSTSIDERIRWRSPLHWLRALVSPVASFSERDDVSKWPLRKAFVDKLPQSTLARRKAGFPIPLSEQVRQLCWPKRGRGFFSGECALYQYLSPAKVSSWIDRQRCELNDGNAKRLLILIGSEVFLRELA
jgi:asparagine synthase (glutamine-hydrolysing)